MRAFSISGRGGDLATRSSTSPRPTHGVVVFAQQVHYVQRCGGGECGGDIAPRLASSHREYRPPGGGTISRLEANDGRVHRLQQIASGRPWMSRWTRPPPVTATIQWTGWSGIPTEQRAASRDRYRRPAGSLWTYIYVAAEARCRCWRRQRAMADVRIRPDGDDRRYRSDGHSDRVPHVRRRGFGRELDGTE